MQNIFRMVLSESGSERTPRGVPGVSERMGNIIIPYGSKILRSVLRRASIAGMIVLLV
jgi:hypothetical protein